ncbi:uncharacterized protein N7459_007224 [Penicillium hispanicum]|uniref:uncharacterized protein n=1 Tax=Penicillium hispanicum TaxID=1080232 RepID=UPI00253F9CA6|nr:uncharacterized protein N7459_007224 [Penicillium hispanicum]KAJ5578260.1 hypothetical protein N7459_007224 [Penicillium hispanicum]
MKIYLIRHAETVHNVAQAYAGTTDSALTNHGVLQIDHLARGFASKSIYFEYVFSSDLRRARDTAEGICRLQPAPLDPIIAPNLREKDFGSLEGLHFNAPSASSRHSETWSARPMNISSSAHVESESVVSMKRRANSFLNEHLIPLMLERPNLRSNVAIVAHGIILRVLWGCLVEIFDPISISLATGDSSIDDGPAAFITPGWSNTGVMELLIEPSPALSTTQDSAPSPSAGSAIDAQPPAENTPAFNYLLHGWSMKILSINNKVHLAGLHRTRGGIGSASHDTRQKKIDHFFKQEGFE